MDKPPEKPSKLALTGGEPLHVYHLRKEVRIVKMRLLTPVADLEEKLSAQNGLMVRPAPTIPCRVKYMADELPSMSRFGHFLNLGIHYKHSDSVLVDRGH